MTALANRLENVTFSQTIAVIRRIAELKAEGRDILSLAAGEVGLPIPEPIREAAAQAALRGEERSPPVEGIEPLKAAIAATFARDNGLEFAPDQILVGSGSKQIIFNALAATVDKGDEVVIPAPYWVSYPDIARLLDAVPVTVPGRIEQSYKLTAEALERAITPRTRWLILNSPCNPTGAVYAEAELAALAEVLRRHPRILVLSDDIYETLVFAPARFSTMAAVAPDLAERVLTVNGFSKRFSMIGWRLGYAGGPAWLIEAMARVQSQVTSGTATITQAGAVAALALSPEEQRVFAPIFAARRDIVLEEAATLPGVRFARPEGAYYLFPDISAHIGSRTPDGRSIGSDVDLADHLLEAHGLVVLPGSYFGLPEALRLSYTVPEAPLRAAFGRLRRALGVLKPAARSAA